ncbi:MAG TPA: choice-of-anchor B family protein [Candidatus Eisenbacteria bacterium]|nr:choice-of-anchor B family protein [Candidatus Eisenbacteria bacterium]
MRPWPLAPASFVLSLLLAAPGSNAFAQSQNISLLANQNLHSQYTGSCAYVHSDGREYAVVGALQGTSIVRLTDPANPVEVAFIPSSNAGIREPDQYQSYLYVGASGAGPGPGIQIISMADPDNPVLVNTITTTSDMENITIDTARGYLYTSGSSPSAQGGMHIYSLADPVNPVQVGTYDTYQIHDVTVKGTRGYACDQTTSIVHILDLTNPATPVEVATFTTPFGTAHTAVPTADDHYLIVVDEQFVGFGFTTMGRPLVYDIQNLNKISLVFSFDDVTEAITHFPIIQGNLLYVAHYTAGVHVYDIADPLRPVKVAFYDTWAGDDDIFAGVYEASPFPSGTFTAVDRGTGLYVFQLNPAYGLVRGTVRAGNKPLVGATVRVLPNGPNTVTTTNGFYGLAPATSGSVTIECSKFGYATQTATLSVSTGSQQTSDLTLQALGTGTLKGVVRRASDQTVLAGSDVSLEKSPVATTTTGMGKYTLSKVPAGSYFLRAEALALAPSFAPISLTPMTTIAADFALQPAPFFDDGETDQGWILGDPSDDATAGAWVRAAPVGTTASGGSTVQPSEDHSPAPGTICFVTGNAPSGAPVNQESLRGKTTLTSPILDLAAVSDPRVSYWLWFYNLHLLSAPLTATVTTQMSNDGGLSWTDVSVFQRMRTPWTKIEFRVMDYIPVPSSTVRIRFIAENRFSDPVEVLIDDVKVFAGPSGGSSRTIEPAAATAPGPSRILSSLQGASRLSGSATGAWAFTLSRPASVRARIIDVQGRVVRDLIHESVPAGDQIVRWDGRAASGNESASGVYWVVVQADQDRRASKVVLTR